ncbi:PRD domain-containing protein [Consotaella aegiceratis]|uniref:PRD domain-containing protein n=1 Tax=Consotaella aegiceratis TaxID=3097961 RepID=UPI002F3EB8AD
MSQLVGLKSTKDCNRYGGQNLGPNRASGGVRFFCAQILGHRAVPGRLRSGRRRRSARKNAERRDIPPVRIVKIFNNNVALAQDDAGRELVVQGRGVAFQMKPDDRLDPKLVERRYYPEATGVAGGPEQLARTLADIPSELIAIAEEILALGPRFGLQLNQHAAVALADHISIALRRAAAAESLDDPLEWEVRLLYVREVNLGFHALDLIHQHAGVKLPRSEALPLALHFVNAQVGAKNLSQAVRTARLIRDILAIIEDDYGLSFVERPSLSQARFATHLRYLFLSHLGGKHHAPLISELAKSFRYEEPRAFACAEHVAGYLRDKMGWQIRDDETVYIALHIQRMTSQEAVAQPQEPNQGVE